MAKAAIEDEGGELSMHSGATLVSIPTNEEEVELIQDAQARLLEEAKRMPRWLKYYGVISYIVYALIAIYSWGYLIYVGIYQAHPRMQIQYVSVVRFLEYNSYSILSPLLCSIFMGILAYMVKKQISLEEGDFFGLIGVFLFLALMSFHDGAGLYYQVKNTRDYNDTVSGIDPPPLDNSARNDLAWQYAWSTRTSCAKRYVRQLIYQHEYDKKHLKKQILIDFGRAKQRQLQAQNAQFSSSLAKCNAYHEEKQFAKTRKWMTDLHKEFKCCGPYGYESWVKWFNQPADTGCDLSIRVNGVVSIPGCYDPLMRWLNTILWNTFLIMIVQGILYIVVIFFALAHRSAMKHVQSQAVKAHSLLNIPDNPGAKDGSWWQDTRPTTKPPVVGTNVFPEKDQDSKTISLITGVTKTYMLLNKKTGEIKKPGESEKSFFFKKRRDTK